MRFWWRKLFNQFQLLMTLRIGMRRVMMRKKVTRTFKKTFSTEKVLLKDFPQFLSVPDAKRDPGNMPKEWGRFHKDSWVFNRVTIPFPNSHFAISSSAGIVNYSMSSHEKSSLKHSHSSSRPSRPMLASDVKCFPQGRIDLRLLPSLHQRQGFS